ncbi:MAG: acyltransferase [Actinomycetia bacterium]|nr:acyltransferase [Actinomycetes bacterium]
MTVFLWHQTAMLTVTLTGLLLGTVPGLHSLPNGPGWILARLAWFPVFAATLGCCWAVFRRFER